MSGGGDLTRGHGTRLATRRSAWRNVSRGATSTLGDCQHYFPIPTTITTITATPATTPIIPHFPYSPLEAREARALEDQSCQPASSPATVCCV
ncbi:hypothetical protein DL769_001314 [Monosporascus sp. CRB-8-3]|nr:hypothetical protein DL769_001314 [Monosporascus sp. CRB-8-3]